MLSIYDDQYNLLFVILKSRVEDVDFVFSLYQSAIPFVSKCDKQSVHL